MHGRIVAKRDAISAMDRHTRFESKARWGKRVTQMKATVKGSRSDRGNGPSFSCWRPAWRRQR
eukprot:3672128-Rhodomonas_salina.2